MARTRQPPRLVQGDNGVWQVHVWNGSRTVRTSLGTKDEAEAKVRFGYWLVEQDQVAPEQLTVDDILTFYWREHAETHVADPVRIEIAIARLRPAFGRFLPGDLKPVLVNRYTEERGAKAGTIRRELGVLIAALNHARKTARLEVIPHIPVPGAPPPRDRWLSRDEIDHLLAVAAAHRRYETLRDAQGRYRTTWVPTTPDTPMSRAERFCWIALEAPARRTTIQTLTWPQVDLKRRIIDFRAPGKTQTKKRQVAVPISDRLHPVLETAYRQRQSDLYVLDHPGSLKATFRTLMAQAGLKGVTPHTLRHTAATHMAQAGVPLAMIAQILGNTVSVVERTYAHWQAEALMKAVNYTR
jgi:integrase